MPELLLEQLHQLRLGDLHVAGQRVEDPGAAALRTQPQELGPGHTIVTVLADYGTRYQSKLFNPEFLKSKGLPAPDWL